MLAYKPILLRTIQKPVGFQLKKLKYKLRVVENNIVFIDHMSFIYQKRANELQH